MKTPEPALQNPDASLPILEIRHTALTWCLALALLPTLLTLCLWLFCLPPLFNSYYPNVVSAGRLTDAAHVNQWLNGSEPVEALSGGLKSGTMLPKEVAHFQDVRAWFRKGQSVAIIGAFVCVVLSFIARRRVSSFAEFLQGALVRSVLTLGILSAMAALLAVWDWKVFFAWIHYPFFGATSWKLPRSSYTLQLFPASFWRTMGVALVGLPTALLLTGSLGTWISIKRKQAASG